MIAIATIGFPAASTGLNVRGSPLRMLPACSLLLVCATAVAYGETAPVVPAESARTRRSESARSRSTATSTRHAWKAAPRQSGFVQRFPGDGGKPDFNTEFAILYDDEAIYVGVWADDPRPDLIRAQLTRRDVDALADAILVGVRLVSRSPHRLRVPAQCRRRPARLLLFDDANQDDTWDAVWTGNSTITPQAGPRSSASRSTSFATPTTTRSGASSSSASSAERPSRARGRRGRASSPQVVSKFGVLDGLDKIPQARRVEFLPYVTGGFDAAPSDPVNHRWTCDATSASI